MIAPAEGRTCCLPEDFTVTPIHTGFLIGKALAPQGPGPWWEYIAIVSRLTDAVHHARVMARQHGSRAWFFEGGDEYREIPLEDVPFDARARQRA